jgi:LPXTG-site transpeptidase (sortase) family protein
MDMVRAGRLKLSKAFSRILGLILVIALFAGVLFLPGLVSSAQIAQQSTSNPYLPIVMKNGGFGPTHTITPSPTLTVTGTPPTPTKTGTAGPSPTQTLTPSPTYTGTLTPNALITISVSGSPANINQNLVFTIKVGNSGTGPTFNNTVVDSFASYLDVLTVTTTAGAVNKQTHSFVANVGDVNPGVIITIVATVRVNTTLTRNETSTNTAVLTYNETLSKSAGVSYQVIYQTLPPTGDLPLNWRDARIQPLSMIPGILLMLAGGVLLVMVVAWSKARTSKYKLWLTVGGALLFIVGFVAAVTTSGVFRPNLQAGFYGMTPTGSGSLAHGQPSATTLGHQSAWEFSTPDTIVPVVTLPDYPVPTPVITITPEPGEAGPDTSEVNRIVIPIINLDTEVKYVPFDGYSWAITGLRQEVAWMGDTSWPGLGSNTGLAGHVTVAGMGDGPFRHLDELPVGELVLIYTEKNVYTYQVRETKITDDEDMSVIEPSANSQISLITCVDWDEQNHMYMNRLVVVADLIRTEPLAIGMVP